MEREKYLNTAEGWNCVLHNLLSGCTAHKVRGTEWHCNSDNWVRNKKLGIITKWISLCSSQVIAIICTKEFHELQALHHAKSSHIDFLGSKPLSPPPFFPFCGYYRDTTLDLKFKILPQTPRMLLAEKLEIMCELVISFPQETAMFVWF